MSIPILEACKKRKRRPKLYSFHTFADPGCPLYLNGPFRDNIRLFLRQCAELEEYSVHGMATWCTLLLHESRSFLVPLYTIEEDVKKSRRPYCDQCRCTGWSNHFVSKRKYHLIIPVDDGWNKRLDDGVFDLQTHLLHGLIHCNGFGHLLCINGIGGGSNFLCGRELMDLWDRICTLLRTRKITVEDMSKKRSMDLRLLHGVAYGHPWFGRWGYRFCRGSFGVKEHHYLRAIEILGSLQLDLIIRDFSETDRGREIKRILRHYRNMSETQLITMKELLRFMLTVKPHAPLLKKLITSSACTALSSSSVQKPSSKAASGQSKYPVKEKSVKYKKFTSIANSDSRWPARRLEYAAEVIASALKEKEGDVYGHAGMTRQDVRDAARIHIGDTGLLDYVLKSLNNVIVGSHVIRRSVNPKTRILEYTIQEIGEGVKLGELEPEEPLESSQESGLAPGVAVYREVLYLYRNVFFDYPGSDLVELATQAVLDSKHFVKEWPLRDEEDQQLSFVCRVVPSLSENVTDKQRELPPGEIVVLPLHATVREVKQAAESAVRDTYCIAEECVITEIEEMEEMDDGEVIFGAVESGVELCVRGTGIDFENPLRYQGGVDNWKVRCDCGARDDDGERMVACDICEVWQHTRCCGIEDAQAVPPLFLCAGCCSSLGPPQPQPDFAVETQFGGQLLC